MCKYIQGNRCSLGRYCHCHPTIEDKEGYDDCYGEGYYSEQDDTMYIPLKMFNQDMREF